MKLEQLIEKMLEATREHCAFKKAFIPEGWTCVQIKKFAKELAKKIRGE